MTSVDEEEFVFGVVVGPGKDEEDPEAKQKAEGAHDDREADDGAAAPIVYSPSKRVSAPAGRRSGPRHAS